MKCDFPLKLWIRSWYVPEYGVDDLSQFLIECFKSDLQMTQICATVQVWEYACFYLLFMRKLSFDVGLVKYIITSLRIFCHNIVTIYWQYCSPYCQLPFWFRMFRINASLKAAIQNHCLIVFQVLFFVAITCLDFVSNHNALFSFRMICLS